MILSFTASVRSLGKVFPFQAEKFTRRTLSRAPVASFGLWFHRARRCPFSHLTVPLVRLNKFLHPRRKKTCRVLCSVRLSRTPRMVLGSISCCGTFGAPARSRNPPSITFYYGWRRSCSKEIFSSQAAYSCPVIFGRRARPHSQPAVHYFLLCSAAFPL